NNLYELELPSGKNLKTIDVSDNKLATIDVSGLKQLEDLNVSDNRLESIDLSDNTTIKNLNVSYNHLATLNLSDNTTLAAVTDLYGTTGKSTTLTVTPQYLYANTDDAGIDLASYDENFQASDSSNVGWIKASTATSNDQVTGGTITKAGVLEFASNITPTSSSTGISYDYQIGATGTNGDNNVMTVNIVQADLMNRLYNPNSGEHFYTKDLNEKDTLVKLGWQAEGIGWVAPQENYPTSPVEAGEAVFRLYNANAGDHHYTKDSKEKDVLVRAGWSYEGVGWYSAKERKAGVVPAVPYSIEVYREYNPNAKEAGAHNYTTSENENDTLVALGWLDEGIGWWALK
ncbi:MAG: hypothetical protein K2H85_03160, partial [Allobaculum sp.]|nr:hypothetical protein [Allobaculum sp.]